MYVYVSLSASVSQECLSFSLLNDKNELTLPFDAFSLESQSLGSGEKKNPEN